MTKRVTAMPNDRFRLSEEERFKFHMDWRANDRATPHLVGELLHIIDSNPATRRMFRVARMRGKI